MMVGFIPMCSALLVFLMAFKVASAHQPSSENPSSTKKGRKKVKKITKSIFVQECQNPYTPLNFRQARFPSQHGAKEHTQTQG